MSTTKGINVDRINPSKPITRDRFLRLPDVIALVGIGKTSIYDGVKEGTFPAPVKLSRRAVCWPESEVQAWIARKIELGGRTK